MTTRELFLQPGEWFVGDANHRLRTMLGSCVSVVLWSQRARVGAMSHFLLATRGGAADAAPRALRDMDGRYGDEALQLMLHELDRRNVAPSMCQAKIFGGGDMFPAHKVPGLVAIGRRNGEAARELLHASGIAVVSESLFGEGHRQIVFEIGNGNVWSRQMRPTAEFPGFAPSGFA